MHGLVAYIFITFIITFSATVFYQKEVVCTFIKKKLLEHEMYKE